jgi:hypothetical protein
MNAGILITMSLLILIAFIFKNNLDIRKLNDASHNINQYIKKSETNDNFMFKSNSSIVSYLRDRDGMKSEIEVLKKALNENKAHDDAQDIRLNNSELTDEAHESKLNVIKQTFRSDLNYLVNLSVIEVNKHLPNDTDANNLKILREIIVLNVFMSIKEFDKVIGTILTLDDFIDIYGVDLSFIISESIYTYKIYNNVDNSLNVTDDLKQAFNNSFKEKADFLAYFIRTYFQRLFNYIENNKIELFRNLENLTVNNTLFNIGDSPLRTYLIDGSKDINFRTELTNEIQSFLFNELPTFYIKSLYNTSIDAPYLQELEMMLFNNLDTCANLTSFYLSWQNFNSIGPTSVNSIRRRTLKHIIETNPIFKIIYVNTIKKYNDNRRNLSCAVSATLSQLPEEYKDRYESNEIIT